MHLVPHPVEQHLLSPEHSSSAEQETEQISSPAPVGGGTRNGHWPGLLGKPEKLITMMKRLQIVNEI